MKKRILMILLIASLALSLLTPAFAEEVPNDTFETATEISVNQSYSDNLSSSSDVDYYQFTLSEDGYINISFSHEFLNSNSRYWELRIYNAENQEMAYYGFVGNTTTETVTGNVGLAEGTYYIAIQDFYYSDVSYSFKVNYASSDAWEKEFNETLDTANEIPVNTELHGAIMRDNDIDYYQFTLLEDGYINISFSHEFINSNSRYWELRIYNAENQEMAYYGFAGNTTTETVTGNVGLAKGTYYIAIQDFYYSDVSYSFKVNYTASDVWEKEFNETLDTANEIPVNTEIHGALMRGNDIDYYQFTLAEDGYINISFFHEFINSGWNHWELRIYNAENQELASYYFTGNTTTETVTGNIGLSKGTYYIAIADSTEYSPVTYDFTVNYTASDVWEKEFNETLDTANEIPVNTELHGALMRGNDIDYYQFTLAEDGYINISFFHGFIDAGWRYWELRIYNAENQELASYYFTGNTTTETVTGNIGLSKGTYYIAIADSTEYSPITYDFTVNYTASDVWEKEFNETLDTANEVPVNTELHGALMRSNDIDYYQFTLASEETITISFSHEFIDSNRRYWNLYLYTYENKEILAAGFIGNDTEEIAKEISLPAGKYFIRIQDSDYSDATYHLLINTASHTHTWSAWTVSKAATCTAAGEEIRICSGCGKKEARTTKALGHNYQNGVCTRCGAKDPNAGVTPPSVPSFTDVPADAWYMDAVNYAVKNGLMQGTGNGKFEPDTVTTRAMIVTVLWRQAGEKKGDKNTFSDVPDGEWYTDAVAWAAANDIVKGTGNGKFEPAGDVTREQMVTILYRYCGNQGIDTSKTADLKSFPDAGQVNGYALDAMRWAVAEGIINGKVLDASGATYLQPLGNASRAEIATILMRFIENILE